MQRQQRTAFIAAAVAIGIWLLIRYGPFIELSGDFVQHFMLVDEIMKHGMRRPDTQMGIMSIYPDGAHWIAAVVGWIGGSGLVAIVLVTIGAVFASYLLLLELIGKDSPVKIALAIAAFLLLAWTHSLIGWEVSVNYFWPQLVDDVVLLSMLLLLACISDAWQRAALVFMVGALAMFVHALIALQILACGLTIIGWSGVVAWRESRRLPVGMAAALSALGIGALAIVALHPSFRAMRQAADNDGYLEFGYSAVLPVILLCGAIGCAALWRGRDRLDTVIACAGVATVLLAVAQYVALHMNHAGSNYAVKKHMFVVVTLAAVNVVRMLGDWKPTSWRLGWLASPVLAGLASFHILAVFNTPVAPVLRALTYAEHAAQFELPGFVPGNTVSTAKDMPPMINFMISMTAFQHPVRLEDYQWLYGADPAIGAAYAMVRRTPEIDEKCGKKFGEAADYVVVEAACLQQINEGAHPK